MGALVEAIHTHVVALVAALGVALAFLWRVWRAGQKWQRARDAEARANAMREAQEIDRAINNADPAHLRDELRRWRRK